MNSQRKKDLLPLGILALGLMGFVLRSALYHIALDEKGLLLTCHPLEVALWICTGIAAGYPVLTNRKQWKTGCGYAEAFRASLPGALGHILAASGILLTVLLDDSMSYTMLGKLWKYAGFLCAPLLLWAAFDRIRGRCPFFGSYFMCSVFFALHLVNRYQLWCADPQLQNYVFAFGAVMALMLFAYQQTAFCVGMGRPVMLRMTAMAAAYLCLVAASNTWQLFLYFGCAVWALTNSCHPMHKKGDADGTS